MKTDNLEKHQFLPSGAWEGFYCYSNSSQQHKMEIELTFKNNTVSGSGIDDIAPFTWKGTYDLNVFKVKMIKTYSTHQISYNGDIDENGIWGIWTSIVDPAVFTRLPPNIRLMAEERFKNLGRGGFHIWPKKNNANQEEEEAKESTVESEKLKKIFIEKL